MKYSTGDFSRHNEEVKKVWDAYHSRKPIRVPMILGVNPRIIMNNHEINCEGYTFRDYYNSPDVLLACQLKMQYYLRHFLACDQEMGIPEAWPVFIDYMNVHECSWLGGTVEFPEGQVPFCGPFLDDDNKNSIFDKGIPEVYSDIYTKVLNSRTILTDKIKEGYEFMGRPFFISGFTGMGTDGPLTVCCDIRGTTEFLTDLMLDTEYAVKLLDFVTEAIIKRLTTFKKDFFNNSMLGFGLADDSIQLISPKTYKEVILPLHRRIVDAVMDKGGSLGMHICGNAQRHHNTLVEELGVATIDTGFPMDFEKEREYVGDECEIYGGPSVPFLETASPEDVYSETVRILRSGIAASGRFILREGNNLPPTVPVANTEAMYRACRETEIY